jgi:cytochrome c oxidase subunit 2
VTANELHIPVRTPVRIVATTADVIHSFWVPELNRKIDTIPGRRNSIELDADAPGVYRGACAEFCGLQHAHMAVYVIAQPEAAFRKWLANESRPAATASTEGARVFQDACSSCHAIRGTEADSNVGPDLTHVGSRTTLAAVTIPNGDSSLRDWITDNQHIKPGNEMPDVRLPASELDALVAYLEGLK